MIEQNYEYYVSLEVANLLKEAGFDWNNSSKYAIRDVHERWYDDYREKIIDIEHNEGWFVNLGEYRELDNYEVSPKENLLSAPTLEVTQRWLREVKGMELDICWHVNLYNQYKYAYAIKVKSIRKCLDKGKEIEVPSMDCLNAETCLDTYEEAQEAGIKKALEIILEKGEYENN